MLQILRILLKIVRYLSLIVPIIIIVNATQFNIPFLNHGCDNSWDFVMPMIYSILILPISFIIYIIVDIVRKKSDWYYYSIPVIIILLYYGLLFMEDFVNSGRKFEAFQDEGYCKTEIIFFENKTMKLLYSCHTVDPYFNSNYLEYDIKNDTLYISGDEPLYYVASEYKIDLSNNSLIPLSKGNEYYVLKITNNYGLQIN